MALPRQGFKQSSLALNHKAVKVDPELLILLSLPPSARITNVLSFKFLVCLSLTATFRSGFPFVELSVLKKSPQCSYKDPSSDLRTNARQLLSSSNSSSE